MSSVSGAKRVKITPAQPSIKKRQFTSSDTAPNSSVATPALDEPLRSFSEVFWDLFFSATGYKQAHLDNLRETKEEECPSHDVVELAAPDLSWTDPSAVHTLREQLQSYVESLRALKAENARQLRSRPFVEQKRYEAMRSRELSQRVTSEGVRAAMGRLNLSNRHIKCIRSVDIEGFVNLKELIISRNALSTLDVIPPSVEVLVASGNAIEHVEPTALEQCRELYVLGLSMNRIRDVSFLLSSFSIVSVDLSFNPISSLEDILDVLTGHPSLREVCFVGCPVSFCQGYRAALVDACPQLVTVDGVAVAQDSQEEAVAAGSASQSPRRVVNVAPASHPVPPLSNLPGGDLQLASALKKGGVTCGPPIVYVNVVAIRGVQVLQPEAETTRQPSAGKKPAAPPPKKGAAKVIVEEERGPQTQWVVNLQGSWNHALTMSLSNIELQAPQVAEDPKVAKGSAPPKGAKAANAVAPVPDSTLPPQEAEAAVKASFEVVLDQPTVTLESWMRPMLLDLELAEFLTLPSCVSPSTPTLDGSVSPTSGAIGLPQGRSLQSSQWLGTFSIPLYEALLELSKQARDKPSSSPRADAKQLTIPLTPQHNTVAHARAQLQQRRQALRELGEEDQKLDAVLAEIVAAETDASAAPPPTAQSPQPPAKGKAPTKQSAAPTRVLSDATVAKQQESANRKAAIEEASVLLKEEEKKLERLSKAGSLSLLVSVSLNCPPISTEPKPADGVASAVPSNTAGGAAKKK